MTRYIYANLDPKRTHTEFWSSVDLNVEPLDPDFVSEFTEAVTAKLFGSVGDNEHANQFNKDGEITFVVARALRGSEMANANICRLRFITLSRNVVTGVAGMGDR